MRVEVRLSHVADNTRDGVFWRAIATAEPACKPRPVTARGKADGEGSAKRTPSKPRNGARAPAREQKRKETVAKRSVKIVLAAGEMSELKKEYDSRGQEEWVVAYTALLAGDDFLKGSEPNTLNKARWAWLVEVVPVAAG